MDLTFKTRVRGGEDDCPACRQRRTGGLGLGRVHTCDTYADPGKTAARARRRRLARLDQAARTRTALARASNSSSATPTRTRSIAADFEVR